jgi:hypothetical protein
MNNFITRCVDKRRCLWHLVQKKDILVLALTTFFSSLPSTMSNNTDSDQDQPTEQSYNVTVAYTPDYPISIPVDDCQKVRMYRLTSMYENSDIYLHFGYCQDLGDGRGYTSGIIGFCTATGTFSLFNRAILSVAIVINASYFRRCNSSYPSI